MDLRLKLCTLGDSNVVLDRLGSLPDEVLIRILSLLPTKYAAATCVLSRKLYRVFPWITILDFDDLPISHCVKYPREIERFPTYVTFVRSVLQAQKSQYLTRFSLRVGTDFTTRYFPPAYPHVPCVSDCLPELELTQINSWISFPLKRCGLRELDLCVHTRCDDGQLPPEIFTCETLEVLKLDVSLGFDRVSTFPLPRLKLLQLFASLIPDDGFLTRLVSSCPLLEDLSVKAFWNRVHFTDISSTSIRRLCLKVHKIGNDVENTDFVQIHTPNLEYFNYFDNVALQYSFQNMNSLVKADIFIFYDIGMDLENDFEQMLNLIRPLSNVQHLALSSMCNKHLNNFVEVKDKLPLFPNLKHLELGNNDYNCWDKVLLAILNCSPILETLVFPQGMSFDASVFPPSPWMCEQLALEQEFCRTTQPIPLCCKSHLKSIVIKECFWTEREIDLIQFLLRHALVLEELVVWRAECSFGGIPAAANHVTLESALKNYPRASVNCSVQVR